MNSGAPEVLVNGVPYTLNEVQTVTPRLQHQHPRHPHQLPDSTRNQTTRSTACFKH